MGLLSGRLGLRSIDRASQPIKVHNDVALLELDVLDWLERVAISSWALSLAIARVIRLEVGLMAVRDDVLDAHDQCVRARVKGRGEARARLQLDHPGVAGSRASKARSSSKDCETHAASAVLST